MHGERVRLLGLALSCSRSPSWQLGPDWGALLQQATHPPIAGHEGAPTYWFFAIALFGAAMTPYEVFFFSSGGGRGALDGQGPRHRCGPTCSSASRSAGCCRWRSRSPPPLVLQPRRHLGRPSARSALPVALALGKVGLALAVVGFFAATFGAALETGLAVGRLVVTALLTGPGALGPRLGGALGAIVRSSWSRLSGSPPDRPGRIDIALVVEVGTAVRLGVSRREVDVDGFETWVRDHVVSALPGAEGGAG